MSEKIVTLDDITHVLTRPGMYLGSIKFNTVNSYIFNNNKIIKEKYKYIPGFITIFKEIVSNSIDEFIKTQGKYSNKIKINIENDWIIVEDNGRGISSELIPELKIPSSVAVFTNLKTGSNFSDDSNSIGQNGVGASITNIFSKEFIVETSNGKEKTYLECKNNLSDYTFKITKNNKNFTKIKYFPDYDKFNLKKLDEIHKNLIFKTIIDYAICFPDIKFIFDEKIVDSNFKKYCSYYSEENIISINENVDICIFSDDYEPISFVNGINTSRNGNHVDFIVNKITYSLKNLISKKYKDIKPLDIKNKLNFIINYRNFKAPRFDSQTKEYLINVNKEFSYLLDDIDFDKLTQKVYKNENLMFSILETYKIKEELKKRELLKNKEKKIKKKNIIKLIEANEKDRNKCNLYITEGESALSSFIEVREKHQAGYPLRGKVISPQDTSLDKLIKNQEISDILSATGLSLTNDSIKGLRYNKIIIMTDSDEDGGAIMVTLVNFFYTFWPDLIRKNKLYWAISPLIIAKDLKENKILEFFSLNEFNNYKDYDNIKIIEHNKGLGSLSLGQYKKMLDTLILIKEDDISREKLDLAFSGKKIAERKEWLLN